MFEMEFDFIDHALVFRTSTGDVRQIELKPRSVADFYAEFLATLSGLDIEAKFNPVPVEIPNPIPFAQDTVHASYDPEYAHRWWQIMVQIERALQQYRSGFTGKSSPIQFFWGSFDL